MSEIAKLSPANVWEVFDLICSVPHPSGCEAELAKRLKEYAEQHGLMAHSDEAGNLYVERPAAPGCENMPKVILQGHLDMVPVAYDESFDFREKAITPVTDGEWVRACGTTLGADDGAGVALSMAALCDNSLKCGPLAGVFTVSEEVGLNGAAALSSDMLDGDYLFNLDGGYPGKFRIGCAGGARQEFSFSVEKEKAPAGQGVKLTISGLLGGHSGGCIHLKRGNAIRFMAEFLEQHPEIIIASVKGGGADNAIPAECTATGVFAGDVETLRRNAAVFAAALKKECEAKDDLQITVELCDTPQEVWTGGFQKNVLAALSLAPDGVIDFDEDLDVVKTSSNLAAVFERGNELIVRTSQRSMLDEEREKISKCLEMHFASFGAGSEMGNVYPAWTPRRGGTLVNYVAEMWRKNRKSEPVVSAMHAGLEAGWFVKKNPALEIITFGPEMTDIHTPEERLNIKSLGETYEFIKLLLCNFEEKR